jgi:parallel beta-helix repeat protein
VKAYWQPPGNLLRCRVAALAPIWAVGQNCGLDSRQSDAVQAKADRVGAAVALAGLCTNVEQFSTAKPLKSRKPATSGPSGIGLFCETTFKPWPLSCRKEFPMRLRRYLIAAAFMISASVPGWAATYYVAPKGTTISPTANGSEAKPWGSVGSAVKAAKAGDTLLLMDGVHDGIKLSNVTFDGPVTIRSMNGKKARVEWVALDGITRNIVFRDISVWPSQLVAGQRGRMVETAGGVSDITFENLDVRSSSDASGYPGWALEDWQKRPFTGFMARGPRIQIINNDITGVGFGIQALGDNTVISNNRVSGFSKDGMRALGHNTVVLNNTVKDCVRIDENHPDGFQSWQRGSPVVGLVLDGNTILEWSHAKVSPMRCKLQGIGLFDGFYDNLIIQNNVVSSSAYHGISVYGTRNAKIVNNTVVSASGNPAKFPWLGIFPHKNTKTPSTDVVVANNLAMKFTGTSSPVNRVLSTGNSVITYPATSFRDVVKFDYVPKTASGFIDTGDMLYAPKKDILGTSRPSGKGPDRGAFEVSSTTTTTKSTTTTGAKFMSAP